MGKISNFFKLVFGFKPSDPKRHGWTLFKSSHKQHNHDEAIFADRGSVQSWPPSVVAKLMGLEALPNSATTNPKQEMGVTPISPPFYAVTSKDHASTRTVPFTPGKNDSSRSCLSGYSDHPNYMLHTESSRAKVRSLSAPGVRRRSKYSNIKQNDDQPREAVGEPKKASYIGTQVSCEVVIVPDFSRIDTSFDFTNDSIYVIKDQCEMPDDVIPNTLSFGVSSEINHDINQKKLQSIWFKNSQGSTPLTTKNTEITLHLLRDLESSLKTFQFHSSGHPINPELFLSFKGSMYGDTRATTSEEKKEDVSLDEEDDGLKTILWEEVLNRAKSWTDYDGELHVITLEVERLIFKDLVNEVVLGEASHGKRIQLERCRRRLSSK
ncbi:protein longifolia 2 [Tanacetum coccineum]